MSFLSRIMLHKALTRGCESSWGLTKLYTTAALSQTSLIKELRERSGAPIVDVKNSLTEAQWDLQRAYDILRQKGLAAAAKKGTRRANHGLIGLEVKGNVGIVVEVNSETDFVARNDLLKQLVPRITSASFGLPTSKPDQNVEELDIVKLGQQSVQGGGNVADAIAEVAATVRENVRLRRGFKLSVSHEGVLGAYVHNILGPGMGTIGSLVALEPKEAGTKLTEAQVEAARELANGLAMHVVGMRPSYVSAADVPAAEVEHERQILASQVSGSNRTPEITAKIVEGKLGKYFEEVTLLDQKYVIDSDHKVSQVLSKFAKDTGVSMYPRAFVRAEVGEGMEKEQADLASQVDELLQTVKG